MDVQTSWMRVHAMLGSYVLSHRKFACYYVALPCVVYVVELVWLAPKDDLLLRPMVLHVERPVEQVDWRQFDSPMLM